MIQNKCWDKINIRLPNLKDIPKYLDYWYRSPFQEIKSSYFNWEKMPKESEMESRLRVTLSSKEHQMKPLFYMVELQGETIGMHTLNEVTSESGDIHAHYFNWDYVGKGYGLVSGIKATKSFFECHDFKYIYARPPHGNPMSSKMMKKIPYVEYLGVEHLKYIMTKPGTLGDCYRISRENLSKIENYIMNLK